MKTLKFILVTGILSLLAFTAKSQTDEVMLVEYVDWNTGSGLGLKIYNPTDATIDLSEYAIQIYNNGNTTPNSTGNLSGNIATGGTAIIGNSQYASACSGDVDIVIGLSGVNDEDVVTLAKNGEIIDAIGALGYTGNYQISGTVVNQSLKWVKVIREEFNCIRYTESDGVSPNSWPTNPGTNFTGWTVHPVTCLDPSVGYSIESPTVNVDTVICAGDSIYFDNAWLFQSGEYSYSAPSQYQCDTIWNLQLNVLGTQTELLTEYICQGDSLFVGGNWQTTPGVYTDTIQNPGISCYSLIETTLDLRMETVYQSMSFISCEPYAYDGQIYNSSTNLIDTLQSVYGCDSLIKDVSILIDPMEVEISGPSGICEGEPLILEATASQTPVWNTGDSAYSVIYTPLLSQWYWAEVSNESCSARDSIYVEVSSLEISIPPYLELDYGDSESLNLSILQGHPILIEWNPDDAGIDVSNPFEPEFSPIISTVYTVVATDRYDCISSDTIYVEVIDPTLVVPNVITPNNDGFNDKLVIEDLPERNTLLIYNRWGLEVFSASPYLNNWDGNGRDLVDGPYFYILTVYFGNQRMDATGNITILE